MALFLTTAWTPAPQPGEFTVGGQVLNGTPDSAAPADLPVTLHVFSGMEETGTYTTALAADGSFHFDTVTPEEGETFAARVVYQDVTYVSDLVTLEPGQAELDLPVTIYETTEDSSAVLVTQLHVFMTREEERLQVGEYYLVSNTGDRTYVGAEDETDQRITLSFTIPDGAEGLNFDGPGLGERYLERAEGFADTEPIPPGTATVEALFSYDIPYREGFRVERTFDVSVASVVLVLSDEGMALEGARLTSEGAMDTQMGPALSYTAGPLAAGEPLAFTLIARPQTMPLVPTGTAPAARNPAREGALGLAALAAAVAAVYWMWRSPGPGPLSARARRGVELIAALDADFEAGRVGKKKYHKERGMLKRQLRVLLGARGYQD
jgi:hypothetical protein